MSFPDLRRIFNDFDPLLARAKVKAKCEIWDRPEFGDVHLYRSEGSEDIRASLPLIPAAVLIAAIPNGDDYDIILTKRSEKLRKHSGQVSFPGGKSDPEDKSQLDVAVREAFEEISLAPEYVEVIGAMEDYETVTGFSVTPVVAILKEGYSLKPDHNEVDVIFKVPLSYVMDETNHVIESRIWQGKERHFYSLPHDKFKIWGATAAILVRFGKLIETYR
jgi:8-oxo-dGTP pyrophosphatase MutT (NUDIX family)